MRVLSIETTDENLKYALKEFDKNGGFEIEFNKRAIIINILAEYAVNNIDTKYINAIIAKNECECTLEFCDYIYENIKKYINRKLSIYDLLLRYTEFFDHINFEGFIRFCLRDYYNIIKDITNEIISEYKSQSIYKNFVITIKKLLKRQITITENLNIFPGKTEKIRIMDDFNNDITNICEMEFNKEFKLRSYNQNALLFNVILTLAPKTITFHHIDKIKNKNLIKIISDIYGNNIIYCKNCNICEKIY